MLGGGDKARVAAVLPWKNLYKRLQPDLLFKRLYKNEPKLDTVSKVGHRIWKSSTKITSSDNVVKIKRYSTDILKQQYV